MKATISDKIRFNFRALKWENLCTDQVETWEILYPDISVRDELLDMVRWLEKVKGTKKARKKNWHRFIANWLARAQKNAVI